MILYTAHTKTRGTEERESALRGREELGVFFIFFSVVLLLKFGRRKRARNFEFSFVRSLFPLHIVVIIISRRENDAIINNNNSREREKERERDLRVSARVFCRFLLPRITYIIDRRRRRRNI